MRTETTGNAFQMRRLGERDVDAILALCEGNRLFYQYHPPMATRESILADMTALPPGKGMEDKAYVGFFEGEKLVAVLDWISGYPTKETAWIGKCSSAWTREIRRASRFGQGTGLRCCARTAIS